jgi:hypothetical protein
MRKEKKELQKELEAFKVATLQMLANKLFVEFMTANDQYPAEPEHFFEEWISRNLTKPDDTIRLWTWRYFMVNLITYRKFHK